MSRTTTRSGPRPGRKTVQATAPPESAQAGDVLTLAEAAAYLRVSEVDLLRMVHAQGLPGRQIGREWRFLRSALQKWLEIPAASRNPKETLLSWAGAFKDDPDLQEIVREAYKQRGRPIAEEGE